MSNVIWIDEDVDSCINKIYSKELESMLLFKVKLFKKVIEAINYLKTIKFEETKIIISGRLYSEFVKTFKENILEMYVIPIIIIFTRNREKFIQYNPDYYKKDNYFYNFGGIAIIFDEIKKFLNIGDKIDKTNSLQSKTSLSSNTPLSLIKEIELKTIGISEDIKLTFEYIDNKSKLIFPLFFKILIENASNNDIQKYNNYLYKRFYRENNYVKDLLGPIKSIPNIPMELISKYYARLYSTSSNFHSALNRDLIENKKIEHLPFIKTLYEGVKLKALPLCKKNKLFRGAILSNEEIKKIESYSNKQIGQLPSSIVFSKLFLSFTKDEEVAKKFSKNNSKNENFSKVIFVLKNDDNSGFNLATHADIENISIFASEKEVLFFPFSSFGIENIKKTNIGKEQGYKINLIYLGKYFKDILNDENLISKENKIPDSEFKKQIDDFGLITDNIKNINSKILYNLYLLYEKGINNIIIGEIKISPEDKNKNIQIINSFENIKRENGIKDTEDDFKSANEKEIKENIEIIINEKKIDFSYYYKFEKDGIYKIQYLFKNKLSKTNHMFNNCKKITKLDFSFFNTKNVTNMKKMFSDCKSLISINLSNFNTQNVTDMSDMFSGCKSLINLDLSSFNTEKVTNMNNMFFGCQSLTELKISNFNTENVIDMGSMFNSCKNLTNLDLSNFNTKNVKNMNALFFGCNTLTNLNLSNFKTQNVTNMNWMFCGCISLTNLNLSNFNTQQVTSMNSMFSGCTSLNELNLSNFNTQKVTEMSNMFFRCMSLKNLDLTSFDTQNVIKMAGMFYRCKSLINLNITNFNTKNVIEMRGMFFGCNSLKKLDLSKFNANKIEELKLSLHDSDAVTNFESLALSSQNNNNEMQTVYGEFYFDKKYNVTTIGDEIIKNFEE